MLILGKHAEEHKGLVCVSEADVLKHCVVIGQSGSGKSYFIARYLEELALRTKARIMVLDPNGDFTNFWKPRESTFWEHGAFAESLRSLNSSAKKQGIASYDKEEDFVDSWKDVRFQFVLAGQTDRVPIKDGVYVAPLMLHWQYLGTEQDFLLNIDSVEFPKLQQGVVTCYHFANDHSDEYFKNVSLRDLENIARDFADGKVAAADYPEASTLDEEDWLAVRLVFRRVRKRFWKLWYPKPLKGEVSIPTDLMGYINYGFRDEDRWQIGTVGLASSSVDDMLLSANAALYRLWGASFGAWEYAQRRRRESFDLSAREPDATSHDGGEDEADVGDLAEVAATETGSYVDARTPTIVVIDEAHNFAPAEPLNDLQERVSDRIATIAAEGRKYGLFLLLATQRPQKLRKGLLQECENSCLLRIQSPVEREYAADALGAPKDIVNQVATSTKGQSLLHGRWVTGYSTCVFGPARTVLGGVGIDHESWVKPA